MAVAKDADEERQSAAELITLLLQDRLRKLEQNRYTPANTRHYEELCSTLLWKHSEAFGKYEGCLYWSEAALSTQSRYGSKATSRSTFGDEALVHEHLFPRKQLISEKLFTMSNPTIDAVAAILSQLNIGVVVTVEEHRRLAPLGGRESDPWERYREAGIVWRNCKS